MNDVVMFKMLSNKTRLDILHFIKDDWKCVCEIIPITKKSQPNVSLQLKKLEGEGIVISKKEGTRVYFKLSNEKAKKMIELSK